MNTIQFDYLINPKVYQVNRLNPHSDHIYYTPNMKYKDLRISQNGNWKFFYSKNLNEIPEGFYKEGFDDESWDLIKVPGHIQLLGYGNPQYVNTMYPWDGLEEFSPPNIPTDFNPVGLYVHEFDLPENFNKDATFISFQGVESAFYLWLNGEFIGYSEDTFTPSEFDLSKYIRQQNNRLCVMVVRFSSGSWLEDQDFFRFSGIFRDVFIYTIPKIHIYDMFIKPEVSLDLKSATLTCEFAIINKENINGFISFKLYDKENNLVNESLKHKICENVSLSTHLYNVNLWSAEMPYLYNLAAYIFDHNNNLIEIVEEKVGFRRFELKDKLMLLNGKRIEFKGVNRHEFNPRTGRSISNEDVLWDIKCMKRNNINAVRTSHYPNKTELYRLCDEYGIYVMDEANIETHGTWMVMGKVIADEYTLPYDNECWKDAIIDRGNSMFQRDKNHPSILIWSCGNESYGGKVLYDLSNFYRESDNSRLVHYEGVFHDRRYDDTSDMESRMYAKPHEIREYLKNNPKKPYISCEYAHAMGNSCGNLEKYSNLFNEFPMYQGGFIWDFIDQAIFKKDLQGNEYLATGGDFLDRPNDGYFCGNGLVFADRIETPKMQEVKHVYENVRIFCHEDFIIIKNENNWITTEKYLFKWELLKDGIAINYGEFLINVSPKCEKKVPLPCEIPNDNGEYILTVSMCLNEDEFWEKAGYELSFGQGVIKKAKPHKNEFNPVKIVHGGVNIGFKMKNSFIMYSKQFGKLISIKSNDKELLLDGMKPDFWRAPTDNDLGNKSTIKWAKWKIASLYSYKVSENLENSKLSVIYDLNIENLQCEFLYEFIDKNKFSLNFSMENHGELTHMPAFGFSFKMPEEFSNVKWYGNGPKETYCDRKSGGKIGIYENKVIDNYTDYLHPQECGNKTDLRFIEITDDFGSGLRIFGEDLFECSILPYTSHEIENAHHKNDLPKPNKTVVHVCKKKCGVGGDDAWGANVYDEYLVDLQKNMNFKIYIEIL